MDSGLGDAPPRGGCIEVEEELEATMVSFVNTPLGSRRALWRTRALVSALASSRFVTIGIPNSAAFLLMRYSSLSIRWDAGSPSWLGMLITSRISLFWR